MEACQNPPTDIWLGIRFKTEQKGGNMGLSIYALKLGDKISREEYDNTGNGWYVYQAHGMEPINHIPTVEEGCYKADVLYSDCDIFY